MRKIVVLVDMDDVMCNFVESLCSWLNKEYQTNVTKQDITEWDLRKFFPTLSVDEIFDPTHTDDFWKTVAPIDGSQEFIRKLMKNDAYDVYICTSSDYRTIKHKFDWVLKRYFPYISWKQVIITKNKSMVRGDILIDDGVHNLENTSFKKILMSTPSNQNYDAVSNGMIRVNTWEEAYVAVHECASELLREDEKK